MGCWTKAILPAQSLAQWVGMIVLLAMAFSGSAVQAQNATSLTNDMIGQWELSTAGRDKTCVITLKREPALQGLKLELEKGCEVLPFTKNIASWSIKGLDIVRFQDAAGQSVIDVTEVESGIFEGLRTGEGIYLLQILQRHEHCRNPPTS